MKAINYFRLSPLMGAVMLCMAAPSWAGSSVTPLAVDLGSSAETGQVNLWNSGDRPILVQVEVVSWSQERGEDFYELSSAFTIAPAIVEIPAKSGQVFRVKHRGAVPATQQAYRLRLEDVTPPEENGGVAYRVKHDLPLMVTPAGAKPQTSIVPCPDEPACVRVRNDGDAHVKVTGLVINGQSWRHEANVSGTVLPGAWKQWPVPVPEGANGEVQVAATTSSGAASGEWTMPAR